MPVASPEPPDQIERVLRLGAKESKLILVSFTTDGLIQVLLDLNGQPQWIITNWRFHQDDLRQFVLEFVSVEEAEKRLPVPRSCLSGRHSDLPYSILVKVRQDGLEMMCVRDR